MTDYEIINGDCLGAMIDVPMGESRGEGWVRS